MLRPFGVGRIELPHVSGRGVEVRDGVGSERSEGLFFEEGTLVDGGNIQTRWGSLTSWGDDVGRGVDGGGSDSELVVTCVSVDGLEVGVPPVSVHSESEIDLVQTSGSPSFGFSDDDSSDDGELSSAVGDAWDVGIDVDLTEVESWRGVGDLVDFDLGREGVLETSCWVTDGGDGLSTVEGFGVGGGLMSFVEEGGGLFARGETRGLGESVDGVGST